MIHESILVLSSTIGVIGLWYGVREAKKRRELANEVRIEQQRREAECERVRRLATDQYDRERSALLAKRAPRVSTVGTKDVGERRAISRRAVEAPAPTAASVVIQQQREMLDEEARKIDKLYSDLD